jgi:predicted nucleotidyltransferase
MASPLPKQPINLMFNASRRQLLAQLLLRPGEHFHVRELARMTGISAGTLHRELSAMAEAGVLLREHAGNQVRYQANQACPLYKELAAIFRKTLGLAGLFNDALAPLAGKITSAFVFGSVASGEQGPNSDVDVLILGAAELLEVVKALATVGEMLGREINPVVMPVAKFLDQLDEQERFAARVCAEPKIFLLGTEDEFAKLVEDRSARQT